MYATGVGSGRLRTSRPPGTFPPPVRPAGRTRSGEAARRWRSGPTRGSELARERSSLDHPVWLSTRTRPSGTVAASGCARPAHQRAVRPGPRLGLELFVLETGWSSSLRPPSTIAEPSDMATVTGSLRGLFRLGTSAQASATGSYLSAVSLPGSAGPADTLRRRRRQAPSRRRVRPRRSPSGNGPSGGGAPLAEGRQGWRRGRTRCRGRDCGLGRRRPRRRDRVRIAGGERHDRYEHRGGSTWPEHHRRFRLTDACCQPAATGVGYRRST